MFRVRLINKVIGPTSAAMHPVCGISGKLYGQAVFIPAFGGPVLELSLEDYERDKFDIIGNTKYRQQWIPEFFKEVPGSHVGGGNRLQQFNELRKRAKAAGVWKNGMKFADVEAALVGR